MAVDALAMQEARASAAMSLTIQILFFHKEGFKLPAPSQFWEVIDNTNIYLCFLKSIQHKG